MYTKNLETKIDSHLLAAHVANNADFEKACKSGISADIVAIIETEMEKHQLFTKGSKKFKADVIGMLQGKTIVPSFVGLKVLEFTWNSRLSGNGMKVI